jgi:hypothetical protein
VEPDLDLDLELEPIQPPTPLLPRFIAIHILSIVVFIVGAATIPFPYVFGFIIVVITIAPVACAICATYLTYLWWSDPVRPRSELFAFLAYGAWVITVGMGVVSIPGWVRVGQQFLGWAPLVNELVIELLGFSFILIASVPLMKAGLFAGMNRRDPDRRRPPMRGGE